MSEDQAADLLATLVGASVRVIAFEPIGSQLDPCLDLHRRRAEFCR
jgi:hypothetical protein